ncbi:MAG: MBL fold metallo-hydrolase [Novosphingobium sp.]|nr:MBL fold metallo-hydrolase [Novosphingobium sp.]
MSCQRSIKGAGFSEKRKTRKLAVSTTSALMTFGSAQVRCVEEVRIANHIESFTSNRDLLEANRYWLYPHFLDDHGGFDLVFQSWIVEIGGRVILIDPCNGNDRPHSVPYFNMLDVPYIERMQASGYLPQDIDYVICTHLHHDHCGWNTRLRDGKWVPTFPNARYIVRRLEYDNFLAADAGLPADDLNKGVFARSVEPVMAAGLMDLVSADHALFSGVTIEGAPGHTFGHQMVHFHSAGQHAYFTGDCFHHPIQLADPTVLFAGADDTAALIATRRRLVELSCEQDAYLIAAHVPAPYAVRASLAGEIVHFTAGAQTL